MEVIRVILDPAEFDRAVHAADALPEGGDMKLCLKRNATVSGSPGVCINWTVQLPSGNYATCQAVVTWKALLGAVRTIESALQVQ